MTNGAVILLLAGLLGTGAIPDDDAVVLQKVFVRAVDRAAPSVVTIETFGTVRKLPPIPGEGGPGRRNPLRMGGLPPGRGPTTGVILSEDGEILTSSFHLTSDPAAIIVTLPDGTRRAAKVVSRDFSRGIALLKVEASGLPVARFAERESVRVGQWALTLGRSFGGRLPAAQMGIVSALDRISGRAIQTDAPTSPSNYGGALIDIEGAVLGVIVPLSPQGEQAAVGLYDSGIGFAVPLWEIDRVIDRMRAGETLHPGFLGVQFDPGRTMGSVTVSKVMPQTAAEAAGIREGDRILRVDDRPVRTSFELQREIGRSVAGDTIMLLLKRGEEEIRIRARLGKRPETPPKEPD